MNDCQKCRKPMYECSNGLEECRNFDCPPGNEAAYHRSWDLVKRLKPLLLRESAGQFSVGEILAIHAANSGKADGDFLLELAKRCGIEEPPCQKS